MLETGAEMVGTTLLKVAVSTKDSVEVALVTDVGKGKTDGLPEVSKEVTTEPVVFLVFDEVAVWTADVERDVNETLGTLVTVTLCDLVVDALTVVATETGDTVSVVPVVIAMGADVCNEDETADAKEL